MPFADDPIYAGALASLRRVRAEEDQARRNAARRERLADTSQLLHAAFSRTTAPSSAFTSDTPDVDRSARGQEDLALSAQAAQRQRAALLDDPDSEPSKQARDVLEATPLGSQLKSRLGERWFRIPVSKLPGLPDALKSDPTQIQQLHERARLRDPSSEDSRLSRESFRAVAQAQNPDYLKQVEPYLDRMSGEAIESQLYKFMGAEGQRAFTTERDAAKARAQSQAQAQHARVAQAAKLEKTLTAQAKVAKQQSEANAGIAIPGFHHTGAVKIRPVDAEKLRSSVEGAGNITAAIGKLRRTMDAHQAAFRAGTWKLDPNIVAEVEDAYAAVKMGVKQFEELGALVGGDFQIIAEAVTDPSKHEEGLRRLVGVSGARRKLDLYEKTINERVARKLKLRGYEPESAGPKPPARVRVTNGRRILEINAADLAEAQRDGFRVVD